MDADFFFAIILQLFDLLDTAKQEGVISRVDLMMIKEKANEKSTWQENRLLISLEKYFFNDKCAGVRFSSGGKLKTLSAIVIILILVIYCSGERM